jgi:putative redox protein
MLFRSRFSMDAISHAVMLARHLHDLLSRSACFHDLLSLLKGLFMSISLKPKETVATFTLSAQGTGIAQTISVGGSAHRFAVDAAPAFGGADAAPSPIAYALGALVSCSQVTAQLAARALNVRVDRFHFDLRADLDTSVLVGGATEGNANFESVILHAVIATDASDDDLRRLQSETERRCPIYQLFSRSGVDLTTVWTRAAE